MYSHVETGRKIRPQTFLAYLRAVNCLKYLVKLKN